MGVYTARLRDRQQVAEATMAFYFDKPDGFDFVGGQSIDLTLIDPPETDAEGNTRAFSLAMAPHEPYVMVATRLRNTAFKRVLKTMPLGTEVKIDGPFGSMTLHRKTARPAIILAGGIGITPFRSMLCQAANANTGHRLLLFYSNRCPEDAAFLAELLELSRMHTNIAVIATMTDIKKCKEEWNGEKGYINKEMLMKFAIDLAEPIYYIAGPPGLVAAMKNLLSEAGVDEEDINCEDFSGY
jgi:ferredoxin-NADP reductase